MMVPLLNDILIVFGLSVGVLLVCHRLHVPAIVGFLLTGVLAGPHGLGLISAVREVEILAEIGVVLLLFTIGIEFSLRNLLRIKRSVLLGGSLQVLLTVSATVGIARHLGQSFSQAIFMGFLVSLSSTAIVLKLLQDRAEIDSPYGRLALAILIFQDVIVVPMMLVTPLLAGTRGDIGGSILVLVAKGIGVILLVAAGAEWFVPRVLYQVARTRSRELFLLSIVVICLSVAWLTHSVGLSLALGAFLAGLTISESEYAHQALGNMLPFRDIFTSFFFVSIGMLLDIGFVLQRPGLIALVTLGVMILKPFVAGGAVVLLGFPLRTAILTGLALGQVGEFSFILCKSGVHYGLIPESTYQVFLAFAVLTMSATPFILELAPHVADVTLKVPLPTRLRSGLYGPSAIVGADVKVSKKDHLIIIGFGMNGRNVARAANAVGIPHVIIEMNPETVRAERAQGVPIHYGDAIQEAVLDRAGIRDARVVVLAISDPVATRRITATVRRLNPKAHTIARTRFVQEMTPLYELGANEVIPEEFETSVEIFARVLMRYLVPRDEIEKFISEVRADAYEMFRTAARERMSSDVGLYVPDVEINTFRVHEKSPVVGKSLSEIGLRRKYGVTLLAIRRGTETLANPDGDTIPHAGDILVILGSPTKLAGITGLFRSPEETEVE